MADLFSMFNVQIPTEDTASAKKETKKKSSGKKESKKTTHVKEESYSLPCVVETGFSRFTIAGTGSLKEKDFINKIYEVCDELKGFTLKLKKSEGLVLVAPSTKQLIAKGEIDIEPGTTAVFGGVDIDISEFVGEANEKVQVEDIQKTCANVHPILRTAAFVSGKSDSMKIRPVLQQERLNDEAAKELTFPLRLVAWGKDQWEVSEAEFSSVTETTVIDVAGVKKVASEKMELKMDDISVLYDKELGILIIELDIPEKKSSSIPEKKEELYPTTDGMQISFLFQKRQITPEEFGGKTEVTKEEILNFCAKLYPEYGCGKVELRYDKDKKLLIPVMAGSVKGALC